MCCVVSWYLHRQSEEEAFVRDTTPLRTRQGKQAIQTFFLQPETVMYILRRGRGVAMTTSFPQYLEISRDTHYFRNCSSTPGYSLILILYKLPF